jgi:Lrp/AsnC family transcriptional regulator, regulator for asnA, asnC and gidA
MILELRSSQPYSKVLRSKVAMREKFDETDWDIIGLLAADGRMTAKTMSKKLGLAEATIRNRLTKLARSNQVRIAGLINPDSFEDKVVALVALEVKEVANLDAIGQQISELPSVQNVTIASGRYDLIVEILVDSNKGIIKFLENELARIKGVGKTETFLILKSFNKWVIPV